MEPRKKRIKVDPALCDMLKYLIAGGASVKKAAMITGAGKSTINKIIAADYDVVKYQNLYKRDEEEPAPAEEQVPGQMKMELPEEQPDANINKMMRFQAHQVDKIMMMQQGIIGKLDRLNDTMSMVLRAIRKE